ncbi:serine hydroxymethyltransferase [Aminomonas paucivorans]|uniref:serine hydroxymethyltransferase n=1 Tax=Aminomonas paucivorans TaxID=81412 RepID=UPI00332C706E
MRQLGIVDPELGAILDREAARQELTLELIASESFVPPAIMEVQGSLLTNKYAEGYPGQRYHGGCQFIDALESLAIGRAKGLFGAEHANVQPHSGVNANLAVYQAVLQPGDTILAMDLKHGGHLSHGSKASLTGRVYRGVHYGVRPDTERVDLDQVRALAREHRPRLLVTGASAYPRILDYPAFREIADEVGALLLTDMAHIAGLVAAGVLPSPVPHCHFVTSTTTKTLRGARGGFILCREEFAPAVDKAIFPGTQGGPILQNVAAKALTFKLAGTESFARYARNTVANAAALARNLTDRGYRIVSGGTDNHLLLVDLRPKGLTGDVAERALESVDIMVNKNLIPFDPEKPTVTSGIRIGLGALTTRGFGEKDMPVLGELLDRALQGRGDEKVLKDVKGQVLDLCLAHPLYCRFGEGDGLLD